MTSSRSDRPPSAGDPAAEPQFPRTYADALERAPFAVVESDTELLITRWNDGAERLFGHARDEAIGRRLDALIPLVGEAEGFQLLLAGQAPPPPWAHTRKDGSRVVCAWSCHRIVDDQGAVGGAIWFGQDATAMAELERQYEDLSLLLKITEDNLPLVLWRIDREGIFTHHAGKALVRAGLEQGQHLGKNLFDLYTGPGAADVRAALAGKSVHIRGEDHGMSWESSIVPLHDKDGQVIGAVGMTLDITDITRAEQELRSKLDLIERQQRVIRDLSTPILQVWDKVLTLPMIGVIDSARTAEVMDSLLDAVSRTRARFAILDLTGVEAVDTKTAAYLIELVRAIRLLGAEGIITGIRPSVAQTVVAIGVDLGGVVTLSNLRAGLRHCILQMRRDAAGATPG